MTQIPDFRADLAAAQQWVAGLMDAIRPEQWAAPTPCADFDVRALLEHLSCHPAKIAATATGADPRPLPARTEIDASDPGGDYLKRATAALGEWADDSLLTRTVTAPWGPAPGGVALGGYLLETVAHGWDLAVATGQDPEADPALVAKAQAVGERAVTDAVRGPGAPFGTLVQPPADAGPTERLAAFLGRSRSVNR
ncbi:MULTISPECIES: TIGR03086 family metal-binding protein [Nocardia]|uniref:TIGR03086 family metal-binding protein n=1 Tax=Nocardia TaxID=1817 RepID=UPI0018938ABC|nr:MULTISPECIES: TIGR03086 family metal-binding protein [Nocardia]MBF6349107.1 TIGR03086 family protein [Nocardia flavorosea]